MSAARSNSKRNLQVSKLVHAYDAGGMGRFVVVDRNGDEHTVTADSAEYHAREGLLNFYTEDEGGDFPVAGCSGPLWWAREGIVDPPTGRELDEASAHDIPEDAAAAAS